MYEESQTAQGMSKMSDTQNISDGTSLFSLPSTHLFTHFESNKNDSNFYYFTAPVSEFHEDVGAALSDDDNSNDSDNLYPPSLWISSPAGATTALHYDVCDNILIQVS